MPAPRMFSTTGSALTADEMAFAWRVFASFSVDMKRGWVKVIRRQDSVTGTIVEYHADKDIAYVTPGGAVDYVPMVMPNPVPYRGVSIGVAGLNPTVSAVWATSGLTMTSTTTLKRGDGTVVRTLSGTWVETRDGNNGSITWSNFANNYGSVLITTLSGGGQIQQYVSGWPPTAADIAEGVIMNGSIQLVNGIWSGGSVTFGSIGYAAELAAEQAAGTVIGTRVVASDGEVLASEADPAGLPTLLTVPNPYDPNNPNWFSQRDYPWEGGSSVRIYGLDENDSPVYKFNHTLTFTVPEDCLSTETAIGTDIHFFTSGGVPDSAEMSAYTTAFNAGVAENKLRRKNWLKKNSDEFIAALKTGFAAGTPGVTRSELQLGRLPEVWEFQIKRDVDKQYDSYTPTNTVGRKTKRDILYSEVAYSEIVTSDTSANLTQAGVKVTTRSATLQYSFGGVLRETTINGSLTQTVTRHNNSSGTQVGLSRQENYSTWYEQSPLVVSSGVMTTTAPPYLADRTINRFGSVLNGIIQLGYNADSTIGAPGNPLTYANYVPPFPVASSNMEAVAPAWIEEWHADTKILYAADGSGASNTQNDSALHGVKQIEITPVGLIANGVGTAAAGESVGVFSTGEDGTQVEMYGTAVYNFDWQTGALTFFNWKPLHGDNGLEIESKIVDLPQGVLWDDNPTNCLVTYRGLHWPDVVAAIRVRDSALPTSTVDFDRVLYTLINAIKAG